MHSTTSFHLSLSTGIRAIVEKTDTKPLFYRERSKLTSLRHVDRTTYVHLRADTGDSPITTY